MRPTFLVPRGAWECASVALAPVVGSASGVVGWCVVVSRCGLALSFECGEEWGG